MNKILFALALAACSNAFAATPGQEARCLALAERGRLAASAREKGMTRDQFRELMRKVTQTTGKEGSAPEQVVDFVYVMQLGQDDAQKLVYLKCLNGTYDKG